MSTGTISQRSRQRDRFTVPVYLGVSPVDGKKKYRSETVRGSRGDAQRRLREMIAEVERGEAVFQQGLLLGDYLRLWLRDYAPLKVREVTLERYRNLLELYVIPRLGKVKLALLSAMQVQRMEGELPRSGRADGQGLSSGVVRLVHQVLRSSLGDARRMKYLGRDVMGLVEPPRLSRREIRLITLSELGMILERLSCREDRLMFALAEQTGLRRGELCGLQWRDVDWTGCVLSVQRRAAMVDGRLDLAEPKSGRGG